VAYALSGLVAVSLAVSSVAGLLVGQRGLYGSDPATLPAFLGQDAISLVVGLPLLLGSLWLARRGSLRGLLLWMGALFYAAYSYTFYVLGAPFGPLFPAHVAIVAASLYALICLLVSIDAGAARARFSDRAPTRLIGGFLVAMALLFAQKWVAAIVATLAGGATPGMVERDVWALDLTVLLPAMAAGGVLLWRRRPWGYAAAGLLLVKVAFTGLALVATTWLATRWGAPADPNLPAYALVGLGGLAFAGLHLRGVDGPTVSSRPGSGRPRPAIGDADSAPTP
jgi:hypothetical protein